MILLDTLALYWWLTGERLLSSETRELVESSKRAFVSAVTGWEFAIKVKMGKWPGAAPLLRDLEQSVADEGFDHLPLTISQAKRAGLLELSHRDPFDRMLAAQALELDIPILTADRAIEQLGCKIVLIWEKLSTTTG